MDQYTIGNRLRELRGDRTRAEVSAELGITPQALLNYEVGLRIPKDELKVKIADFFGKSVQELFFDP